MNFFLNCILDKNKDQLKFMDKAEYLGGCFVNYFYKYFTLFICPLGVLFVCIGNAFYNILMYGHLDPSNLFRTYRLVYDIEEKFNFFIFETKLRNKKNYI